MNYEASPADSILIVDYGSQYTRLIARRLKEIGVGCEIVQPNVESWNLPGLQPKGVILSGGPAGVHDLHAPSLPEWVGSADLPILGICYGLQLLAHHFGGTVQKSHDREYGPGGVRVHELDGLFTGIPNRFIAWMSHGDSVTAPPPGAQVLALSDNGSLAALRGDNWWGVQFHPEVIHTQHGTELLSNFCLKICSCAPSLVRGRFIDDTTDEIRRRVGSEKVLCAISGGVDSAVAAKLVHSAIGEQLHCLFVDNGLLRNREVEAVLSSLRDGLNLSVEFIQASDRFLNALKGISDPEQKRRIIGATFIEVFECAARRAGPVRFLAQGTLFSDVIESGGDDGTASVIKSHHNVAGLPEGMRFELIEPLRGLFKDEVRRVGKELQMPDEILSRQPFPGPGLAIRLLGEVTPERLERLRLADSIVQEEIEEAGFSDTLWQYFAILLPLKSVGVTGDERAYGDIVIVRAVTSEDAMTAESAPLPYEILRPISRRIVQEVPGVNRVCYDITTKPPGTIEWE